MKGFVLTHAGTGGEAWDFFIDKITPEAKEFKKSLYQMDCEYAKEWLSRHPGWKFLGCEDNCHARDYSRLLEDFEKMCDELLDEPVPPFEVEKLPLNNLIEPKILKKGKWKKMLLSLV